MSIPCPTHPYTFSSVFFLVQQHTHFQGHPKLLFLSPIGLLGGRVRAQWFHCPKVSHWDLRSTLPFPSCFLYNPKFPAIRLLCLPLAFMLVSCLAYSTLRWRWYVPPKRQLTFNELNGVISQKMACFITTGENLKSYILNEVICSCIVPLGNAPSPIHYSL
jgi:hypothetical protein